MNTDGIMTIILEHDENIIKVSMLAKNNDTVSKIYPVNRHTGTEIDASKAIYLPSYCSR